MENLVNIIEDQLTELDLDGKVHINLFNNVQTRKKHQNLVYYKQADDAFYYCMQCHVIFNF